MGRGWGSLEGKEPRDTLSSLASGAGLCFLRAVCWCVTGPCAGVSQGASLEAPFSLSHWFPFGDLSGVFREATTAALLP